MKVEPINEACYTPAVILAQAAEMNEEESFTHIAMVVVNKHGQIYHLRSNMDNLQCMGLANTLIDSCMGEGET